jgi:hypothetical protein
MERPREHGRTIFYRCRHCCCRRAPTRVDQSAQDLREFHDVVARARRSPLPPFPRATVLVAQQVVDKLTTVESDLEEVLLGLGIGRPVRS